MTTVSPLSIELIEKRPLTAVKVLEGMEPSDVAQFFEALPTRIAVALVSKVSVLSAATLLDEMTPVSAAAILSDLDYQTTASILRVEPDAAQKKLLSALPKKLCADLKSTLSFPADTVGAKMSTIIVIMFADQSIGEAFAQLRQIKRTKTGIVYIADAARKLIGLVTAEDLLRLSNESRLGDVMETSVPTISARSRLSAVKSLQAWDDYTHLPVVNRQKILIGALARRTFRQKIVDKRRSPAQSHSILSSLASAFLGSSVGLVQVLTDVEVTSGAFTDDTSKQTAGDAS